MVLKLQQSKHVPLIHYFYKETHFQIDLDNGYEKESITLTDDGPCLYLDGMVWRTMQKFSMNCVVTVLCDREYKFDSLISSYEEFIKMSKK